MTATYIYNCPRCKTGRRVDYPIADSRDAYRDTPTGRVKAGIWITACGGGKPTEYGGDVENGLCPSCRRAMKFGRLDAHYNPDVKCSAKCTGARGHVCDCSCGGANHASAH